ncbi:MAG: aminopeptidase [Candidatus Solibacter sp.]|nr:aminopeptidase [Candidatus Solibacter sp.]
MKTPVFVTAAALLLAPCLLAQKAAQPQPSPGEASLMGAVSADSMRGDVSFLASDLLEGRDTPSRGLEIAAEYLASQFRAMGMKPAGTDGYFQIAEYAVVQPVTEGFTLTLESAAAKYGVKAEKVMVTAMKAAQGAALEVVQIDLAGELPARAAVEGKAALLKSPGRMTREAMRKREQVRAMGPAVVISFTPYLSGRPQLRQAGAVEAAAAPSIAIQDSELQKQLDGAGALKASFQIPAPVMEPAKLKNVVAVLEGTGPVLKNQYIILSGHYDHTGVNPRGEGDRIMNGANDDASGTSVVLEIARAFVKTGVKPKRSIVFALWFGEEKGLFGSTYYAENPVFPLKDTVAMVNFEHMGRTDGDEGSTLGRMSLTGIDYTEIGQFMADAGRVVGIDVYKHEKNSDLFFSRSDNQPFADAGVPAHAVLGCYIFPDYHRPGDEWHKLDYDNMARLTRVAAVAALRMANRAKPPAWNAANPRTAQYVKASQELYGSK